MNEELQRTPDVGIPAEAQQTEEKKETIMPADETSENEKVSNSLQEEEKPEESIKTPEPTSGELTSEEVSSIVRNEVKTLKDQITDLNNSLQRMTAVCKDSLDYCQRYERNTVSVLQEENKKKDKYITGILLIDLLKPVAEICAKIEKRIKKCTNESDRKFLLDLLDDITDVATDDYNVEINRTEPGETRPENISKVDDTISTDDETLKGKVAESLCSSWVLNGRVIQKERVIVYKYENSLQEPEYQKTEKLIEKTEPSVSEEVSTEANASSILSDNTMTEGKIADDQANKEAAIDIAKEKPAELLLEEKYETAENNTEEVALEEILTDIGSEIGNGSETLTE